MKTVCPVHEEMKDVEAQTELELERTNTPTERAVRIWRSCCLRIDRDVVQYFTKYFILIGLMAFFSVELHLSETCEQHQMYQSLLTLVLGIAIPSPSIK